MHEHDWRMFAWKNKIPSWRLGIEERKGRGRKNECRDKRVQEDNCHDIWRVCMMIAATSACTNMIAAMSAWTITSIAARVDRRNDDLKNTARRKDSEDNTARRNDKDDEHAKPYWQQPIISTA